jgi:DNA-binding response OmpR family regulator
MVKILLIDDEEHIRRLYAEELSEEGYEVVTVASGHNLLRKIDRLQPDVVILDIRLVDYDGLTLLQEIRDEYHHLPVIICTAYDIYKLDPKAFAADYYVIKSVSLEELKLKVKRAIGADTSIRPTGTY